MNFSTFLNQCWHDHALHSIDVANRFSVLLSLASSNDQLAQVAGLVTHVMGEHLGEWNKAVEQLEQLRAHNLFIADSETDKAICRSQASLRIAAEQNLDLSKWSRSDQIRIRAVAASAMCERDVDRATSLLQDALRLAKQGLDNSDPAHRALAVTGNSLACTFEEKANRTEEETQLMILAAKTARTHWEKAGTWLEISRAEYRLSMSYLQARLTLEAREHALICLELCRTNNAGALDLFYAFECLATTERECGNEAGFQLGMLQAKHYFEQLADQDKSWCEPSLVKLSK